VACRPYQVLPRRHHRIFQSCQRRRRHQAGNDVVCARVRTAHTTLMSQLNHSISCPRPLCESRSPKCSCGVGAVATAGMSEARIQSFDRPFRVRLLTNDQGAIVFGTLEFGGALRESVSFHGKFHGSRPSEKEHQLPDSVVPGDVAIRPLFCRKRTSIRDLAMSQRPFVPADASALAWVAIGLGTCQDRAEAIPSSGARWAGTFGRGTEITRSPGRSFSRGGSFTRLLVAAGSGGRL
jgi:hypothetical protein